MRKSTHTRICATPSNVPVCPCTVPFCVPCVACATHLHIAFYTHTHTRSLVYARSFVRFHYFLQAIDKIRCRHKHTSRACHAESGWQMESEKENEHDRDSEMMMVGENRCRQSKSSSENILPTLNWVVGFWAHMDKFQILLRLSPVLVCAFFPLEIIQMFRFYYCMNLYQPHIIIGWNVKQIIVLYSLSLSLIFRHFCNSNKNGTHQTNLNNSVRSPSDRFWIGSFVFRFIHTHKKHTISYRIASHRIVSNCYLPSIGNFSLV